MSEEHTDTIHTGDCLSVLQDLEHESVHAIVTDPPYGLNFMPDVTNGWDDFESKEYQGFCETWARRAKKVLKPGGHLLAFSGNRTHHRLFTGVEDAGYEIRDTLTWHYGSGFPKATDVSKTIDKREGAERETVGQYESPEGTSGESDGSGVERMNGKGIGGLNEITEPATEEAKKWDGWKTGLKPATEYIVMARKPFEGATVDCVLEHGAGALNIDATRIEHSPHDEGHWPEDKPPSEVYGDGMTTGEGRNDGGRYPSNVAFDEIEAKVLDNQVGNVDGCQPHKIDDSGSREVLDDGGLEETGERLEGYDDSGGPSRYFYTSKASKAERTLDGSIENAHPTVKPQDLMEWLIKLVTREGQVVLDPFTGSGTTCKAAKDLNRRFIGIEKQEKWADVARVRCNLTPNDPSVVRDDEKQSGLENYD